MREKLINFDCPHCSHNLEVDARGAGFIVRCPECDEPLQIPTPPPRFPWERIAIPLAVALLFVATVVAYHLRFRDLVAQRDAALSDRDQTAATNDSLAAERLQADLGTIAVQEQLDAVTAERDALLPYPERFQTLADTAAQWANDLSTAESRLLNASRVDRDEALRDEFRARIEAARDTLPAAPDITPAPAGQGIAGRRILFPVLPARDGRPLHQNAEIVGLDGAQIAVRYPGGSASYHPRELHLGVLSYLPVDPLLAFPERTWNAEIDRLLAARQAARQAALAAAELPALSPEPEPAPEEPAE